MTERFIIDDKTDNHLIYDDVKGEWFTKQEVVALLNKFYNENEQLRHQVRVLSAHLLSDECALTDSQIRKIKGELDNV